MDHVVWPWWHVWWLTLPLAGMAIGAFAMWLRYRREVATLELLRAYAAQGKEPPPEIAQLLQRSIRRSGRTRDWRRAIFFACLAAAFVTLSVLSPGPRVHHGFLVPVVIFAALAVWSALSGLLQPKHDER